MAHINANRCTGLGAVVTHTAASAGVTSNTLDTHQAKGCIVYINVTAITGTSPTLTVTLKGLDPIGQTNGYTVIASAAISATGLTVLKVYPALTASANAVANDVMPAVSQIVTAIGGTTPAVTATVAVQLVY
jgi:hypothetical protein